MIILTQFLETENKYVDADGEHIIPINMRGAFRLEDMIDYTYTTLPNHEGCWMLEVFTFAQRSHIVGIFESEEDVLKMIDALEDGKFFDDFATEDHLSIEEIAVVKDISIVDIIL